MSFRNHWMHHNLSKKSLVALAAGSAAVGLVNSAFAQNGGTWTYNGNDNWSSGTAWLNELLPDGIGQTAGFGSGGGNNVLDTLTVTLDTNRTIGTLQFDDSDVTNTPAGWVLKSLGGQVLTLQPLATERSFIFVDNLGAGNGTSQIGTLFQKVAHITANLAGTGGFVKDGAGTLILSGNNSGLSGEAFMLRGALVLDSANALGTGTINQYTGQIAFRGDTGTNFGTNIRLNDDTVFGTGNTITAGAQYGAGSNQIHTIGNVLVDSYGLHTIGVSGSNGYGLTMGRLTVHEGINLINQGNSGSINGAGSNNNVIDAGSGLLTVGTITYDGSVAGRITLGGVGTYAGNITLTNGLEATGGGSADLIYSGDHTLTINGAIGTGGNLYVTGGTTGSTDNLDYQAGVGTVILNSGALPSNHAVTINGGSLLLNGAVTHSISGLTMGGATLTTGVVPAHLGTGSGTAAIGSSGILVNDSVMFDTGTTLTSVAATAGSIAGRLDLGSSSRNVEVNGVSTLDVSAVVSGSGGIIKSGTGALNLTAANSFTGGIDVVDGVVSGKVQLAGNSLGSTGANVSLGGAIRVNGIASPGTATVNTLTSKDTGANSGLIVDASAAGVTTLNINSYGGREGGTHGTIKVVPVTGSLNTNEIIHVSTGMPLTTNGMLPAYFAVQNSGSDTQLGFASTSANNIVSFGSYTVGGINAAGATAVYDQTGNETLSGDKQVFGLRIGAGLLLDGSQVLTLGNGSTGFGGLIMNGGAMVDTSSVTGAGNDELVLWSGGTDINTIASNINLNGDMTTAGSQQLELSGSLAFNGVARNLTVTGGTALLSSSSALSGSTGFTKRGGGVLAVANDNSSFSGPITVESGTLQLGNGGSFGSAGSSVITNNANLTFSVLDPTGVTVGSFNNAIGGAGDVWVDVPLGDAITLAGNLTYTGDTNVKSGTLKISGDDRIPTTSRLFVGRDGDFDLNGFDQTLVRISGQGTISAGPSVGPHTLTISGSATFDGALRDGPGGSLALVKTGPGTLVLTGADSLYTGTIVIGNGGAIEVRNGAAGGDVAGNASAGDTPLVLANGSLILNNDANRTLRRNILIQPGDTGTITVLSTPNPNTGNFQFVTTGASTINGFFNGGGTMVLDLRGRQLDAGANGVNTGIFNGFTGTVNFLDSNPVGSKLSFAQGVANFTSGNEAATFNFGSGYNTISFRNGTTTFAAGFVSGGTNTVFKGCENGAGRTSWMQLGGLPGDQTFAGRVIDAGTPEIGGFSPAALRKVGASSSVTLTGASAFSQTTQIFAGTLALGTGGDIKLSPLIDINPNSTDPGVQTSTLAFSGGTMSDVGQFVHIAERVDNGTQSLSGALLVPNGFVTPAGTTFIGGGTVYGNLEHGAGSINPGTTGDAGTLTFANNLHLLAGGNIDFNVTNGSFNVLGNGVNDMIDVLPTNGLSLDGGNIRVNFASGTADLAINQYYPLIRFDGTIGGGGTASLQAFAALALVHGSLDVIQGTGSLSNTIGAKIAQIGGATVNLTWAPTQGNTWDIVTSKNFKQTGGGGGSLLFFNTDAVTFDDSTTIHNVVMAASGFQPASVTVNTDNTYTFSQKTIGQGSIIGATNLVKEGSGTLFVEMGNDFTGGATINGGWVVQDVPNTAGVTRNPLGTQTITFNNDGSYRWVARTANANYGPANNATAIFNGNNTVYFPSDNAGTQNLPWTWFGEGTVTADKPVGTTGLMTMAGSLANFAGTLHVTDTSTGGQMRFNSGGNVNTGGPSMTMDLGQGAITLVTRNANAPYNFGALRGGANTAVTLNGTGVLTVGGKEDSTFNGIIQNNAINNAARNSQVVKVGPTTTWTLTNLQTYVGSTLVNEGTLALVSDAGNNLVSPTITVAPGAVLDVNGLQFGLGMVLNADQRLISNGSVVGPSVEAVATSTVGGTQFDLPLIVDDGATISPGNNSVGSLTVSDLQLGQASFLIEVDQNGIDSVVLSGTQGVPILQANPSISLVNLGGFIPGSYTFLDYDGDPNTQFGIENGFTLPTDFPYEVHLVHDTANTRVLMEFVNNSAQWFVNSDGTWSTASNWTLDGTNPSLIVPNSVTFGTFINAPRTVNVNGVTGNITNSIVFDSPISYTIDGPGTLTLDSGITAPVTVLQGDHAINAPIRALKTVGISVPTGATLSFGGTIVGQSGAGITKIGAGQVTFTRFSIPGSTLNVGAGTVVMSHKPAPNSEVGTSVAGVLTIAPGAGMDLTNNALILDSANNGTVGTQLVELRAELADGRLFSSEAGGNTTLGYRNNNTGTTPAAGTTNAGQGLGSVSDFGGVGVDNTSILVRVTYTGDTNLDGVVNVLDLVNLALNWQSTNAVWAGGDFNYDGLVDATDLGLLAQGWQLGDGNPLPSSSLDAALTAAGVPSSAVPEPSSLALLGAGALGLLSRRRRRA